MNSFPTGIKDLDLRLLSEIKDDKDLLNILSLGTQNKMILRYLNDESLWRNRFRKKYPEDFEYVQSILTGTWKNFYLSLVQYLDTEGKLVKDALFLAVKTQNWDLSEYFLYKISDDIKGFKIRAGLDQASKTGNIEVIKFFLDKGSPVETGDGRVRRYVTQLKNPLYFASREGQNETVTYLISRLEEFSNGREIDALYSALKGAREGLNTDLEILLKNKIDEIEKEHGYRR